jgi:hypothetical protein
LRFFGTSYVTPKISPLSLIKNFLSNIHSRLRNIRCSCFSRHLIIFINQIMKYRSLLLHTCWCIVFEVFEFKFMFEFICLNVFVKLEKNKAFTLYPSIPFWPTCVPACQSQPASAAAQPTSGPARPTSTPPPSPACGR